MPRAENEVVIRRPVDEVFAFLSDGENDPRWRPAVLDVKRMSGDGPGLGATYRQGVKGPFGRRVDADYEVTAYEPGRLLAFRATAGPVRPEGRYELAAERDSTRVRFALEADLRGPQRMMSPMVAKAMRGEVENLDRLRALLEG